MVDEVALYVRAFMRGIDGNVSAIGEARQWAVHLGLTPTAMLKNRWKVRREDIGARETPTVAAAATPRRLKVAD
jgi:hypothetical protein